MFGRKKIAMLVAEFLGTGILTLVVLAVQRSTIGVPYFVGLAAGLAVILLMLIFGNVSGAHLNPAVTIALWTTGKVKTVAGVLYIIVQLLGAWVGYLIYTYFVNSSLQGIGGNFTWRVAVAEGVGALIFAFAWTAVVAQKRFNDSAVASAVGISFALGLIIAAVAGIGLINPALALGTHSWDVWGSMGWGTYVAAPIVGAVIGANLHKYVFAQAELELAPARAAVTSSSSTKRAAPRRRTTAKKR